MIYLNQGQNNTVAAVCSRNATLSNPVYLWSMTHLLTQKTINFIPFRVLPVGYTALPPYDLFCIDVDDSIPQVLSSATICGQTNIHAIPGQWYVKIYEQTSTSNLNPDNATNMVNQTMVTLVGINQNNPVIYSGDSQDDIFIVYNPDND